jgi:uncharacterized protein
MKKIVISGGTGMIGKRLTKMLVETGYEVIILTRNPEKYKSKPGISYAAMDLSDAGRTAKIIEGVQSIINLAGAGIADKRWSPEYKEVILNSRIDTTAHLVEAMSLAEKAPESFISASAVGIYGNRGNEKLNEKSHVGDSFLSKVSIYWEHEADKCHPDVRLVKSRIGIVLAREGGALPKMLTPYKFFIGGAIGTGQQWMSWIHIDDICRLFLWCIENSDVKGVLNFVAPNPVTMNDFAKELGHSLHRPSIFKVPEFVIKLMLGESAELVLSSQRIYPTAAEHLGFDFKYPNLNSALKDLVIN